MRNTDRIAVAFCLAATLYVLIGFVSRASPKGIAPILVEQIDRGEPALSGAVQKTATPIVSLMAPIQDQAFAPDAFSNLSRPSYLKGPLPIYGSFLDRGDSTGSVRTAAYKAVPDFYLFVSGFPNRPGNRLLIEVETEHGGVVKLQVSPFEDTGSKWLLKRISLRPIKGAKSFRIFATDANKGPEGWLGFSAPFEDREQYGRHGLLLVKQLGLCVLAVAAAFVALLAPGLILRRKLLDRTGKLFSLIWVTGPGLIGLALVAVAAWTGPPHFKAASMCRYALGIFFIFATWRFLKTHLSDAVTPVELRVLLVVLLLVSVCVAKFFYSLGPVGELFHDEVSRTLEVGGRSDSRLPYHVAQLAGFRQKTNSPFANELYGTWTFSDRGQLVALAATPLVLAGPVYMPDHKPGDVWTVFDPQGFAAYRCAMIVFAASCLLAVFGVSRLFLREEWSLFAVLVTATAPFFVHETYFTWPKMEAAAFVLLAGYLVLGARFLLGGLALGLGYMCHPSALLSTPAILGLIVLLPKFKRSGRVFSWREVGRWIWGSLLVLLGLGVWILFWRVVNGPNYTQGKFLSFALASGPGSHTLGHWLQYRWTSLLNTFVPLNQFLFHGNDENVNAIEGPSPGIVRFFVQPWSTVPAAVGFLYFFCLLRWIYLGFARAAGWLILTLLIPVIFFTAYMGIDSSGMLKEGLHAWFLILMIFSVVIWKKYGTDSQAFWRVCNWALLTRALDVSLMMLLPVIWTQRAIVRPPFTLTDVVALCMMIGGTIWLCGWTFELGERLRFEWQRKSQ